MEGAVASNSRKSKSGEGSSLVTPQRAARVIISISIAAASTRFRILWAVSEATIASVTIDFFFSDTGLLLSNGKRGEMSHGTAEVVATDLARE
ncbi:hypothetical protein N7474_008643 [Penicillium riverlandense]|uniref:uncharacterized protein n=1 Tax=Penicillium riverlandense TaxID=1903569 RepID=UPI00254931D3|nr:uncharacterized protein N7474_008643 [Penicillium riverlandense]KAJ5812342.1 hypothetical protein N7474_008643 [Penicillium riverlandense]